MTEQAGNADSPKRRYMSQARVPERLVMPGSCATWNRDRTRWCTLLAGHQGQHVSENDYVGTVAFR